MIEKMTSKWLSLATTPILGQAPSPEIRIFYNRKHFSHCIAYRARS